MQADFIKEVVSHTRPLKCAETGLAAKFFVIDEVAYSYYRAVLLSTPAPGFPNFVVDGDALIKAVAGLKGEVKLSVSDTRLTMTCGKVRTWLPLFFEELPMLPQPTHFIQVSGQLLPTLKELAKLVPEEAPRLWGTSLLLRGEYGYATDSVYMVRTPLGVKLPFEVALPKSCVTVLTKLSREPVAIAFERNTLTFTFSDHSYMQTPVLAERWPDLDTFFPDLEYEPVVAELVEALEQVKAYAEPGVTIEFLPPNKACFNTEQGTADMVFDTHFIKKYHTLSLQRLFQFYKKESSTAMTAKFISIQGNNQTVVLAFKG